MDTTKARSHSHSMQSRHTVTAHSHSTQSQHTVTAHSHGTQSQHTVTAHSHSTPSQHTVTVTRRRPGHTACCKAESSEEIDGPVSLLKIIVSSKSLSKLLADQSKPPTPPNPTRIQAWIHHACLVLPHESYQCLVSQAQRQIGTRPTYD